MDREDAQTVVFYSFTYLSMTREANSFLYGLSSIETGGKRKNENCRVVPLESKPSHLKAYKCPMGFLLRPLDKPIFKIWYFCVAFIYLFF